LAQERNWKLESIDLLALTVTSSLKIVYSLRLAVEKLRDRKMITQPPLWPLALYAALVAIVVSAMLGLSYVLGERHKDRATGDPYESGVVSTGSARVKLSVKYYLVAVFFVIFDLEAVFIFAWAVAFHDLGWAGYAEIFVFIFVLLVGLIYIWRNGALDWGKK
jgi:NADH-quinone oxidoreductase subunit A